MSTMKERIMKKKDEQTAKIAVQQALGKAFITGLEKAQTWVEVIEIRKEYYSKRNKLGEYEYLLTQNDNETFWDLYNEKKDELHEAYIASREAAVQEFEEAIETSPSAVDLHAIREMLWEERLFDEGGDRKLLNETIKEKLESFAA